MNNNTTSHVPFAQLPPEARFLFSICLMTIYGPERPPAEKVRSDLEMIWNTEQLTLDDFRKPGRMSEVSHKYAAISRNDVWWLDMFEVSREEAGRTGFFEWRRSRRHRTCASRQTAYAGKLTIGRLECRPATAL
jgi:hypothetical protein